MTDVTIFQTQIISNHVIFLKTLFVNQSLDILISFLNQL